MKKSKLKKINKKLKKKLKQLTKFNQDEDAGRPRVNATFRDRVASHGWGARKK